MITVSQLNVNYLKDKYADASGGVRLVYNGLDLEQFRFEQGGERSSVILAVGRLVEKKGFGHLVAACALLRARGVRFRCEIVGGGVLEPELIQQIRELDLEDCVLLEGPMSQEDVKKRISRATLLAAPCVHARDQDRDGLPTILLEAMAMGTPCISTPVTGIPEIVFHEQTGLMVPERNETVLADACERLLSDRKLAVELSANARQLIESQFDIERNTAEIRAFFSQKAGVDLLPAQDQSER